MNALTNKTKILTKKNILQYIKNKKKSLYLSFTLLLKISIKKEKLKGFLIIHNNLGLEVCLSCMDMMGFR